MLVRFFQAIIIQILERYLGASVVNINTALGQILPEVIPLLYPQTLHVGQGIFTMPAVVLEKLDGVKATIYCGQVEVVLKHKQKRGSPRYGVTSFGSASVAGGSAYRLPYSPQILANEVFSLSLIVSLRGQRRSILEVH